MGATPHTIWEVPAYLPYLQPPLTDEAVAKAEARIGNKLPTEYLDLLRVQNGGHIRFSLPDTLNEVIAGIGPYFPSITRYSLAECQEFVSYQLDGLIPFDGDGHWHLCLDYRNGDTPSVTYADVECDEEQEVADSFADYLALLRVPVKDEVVLEGAGDLEAVALVLSPVLGVVFETTDHLAQGFARKSAHIRSDGAQESVWLSPNLVPSGFVRPDDRRYSELKDLLPGQSPRFPEIPPDSCLVDMTAGIRSKVLQACTEARLKVRPLREYFEVA